MISVIVHFWLADNSEIVKTVVMPTYPNVRDVILFQDKWYKVEERSFDLDTGKYTKVHCKPIHDNI